MTACKTEGVVSALQPAYHQAPFEHIDSQHDYDSIFDINVKGLLFTVQKALPLLPDGASIILNASIVASKDCRPIVFIAPQRPPCALSREPGQQT